MLGGIDEGLDTSRTYRSPLWTGTVAADGDVTAWTTNDADSLPGLRDAGAAVVAGNRLYSFGGQGQEGVALRDALVTTLGSDGTLSAVKRPRPRPIAKPHQQFAGP